MIIIKSIRCLVADLLYWLSSAPLKSEVDMDVSRNLKWDKNKDRLKSKILRLNHLLLTKREFRSIFYFRMKRHKHLSALCKVCLPCVDTIEVGDCPIGGGLLISHYHSVICPKEAGENLRIGPGAVIDGASLGNNVYVASNSSVIGHIHIGDNVIIGAGSVVTTDLGGNGVYVGNPAKLIKPINDNEALLNEIL